MTDEFDRPIVVFYHAPPDYKFLPSIVDDFRAFADREGLIVECASVCACTFVVCVVYRIDFTKPPIAPSNRPRSGFGPAVAVVDDPLGAALRNAYPDAPYSPGAWRS